MPSWCRSSPKSSRPEPVQGGAVELRLAAHVVVDARRERLALVVVPGVLGDVAVLDEDLVGVPVLDLARQPVAALEEEDPEARRGEVPGERPAAGAAADDDDVVVVVAHDPVPPAAAVSTASSSSHTMRGVAAPVERLGRAFLAEEVDRPALERVDAIAAARHQGGVHAEPGRERELAVELDALDLGDRRTAADHRHRPLVQVRERLGASCPRGRRGSSSRRRCRSGARRTRAAGASCRPCRGCWRCRR